VLQGEQFSTFQRILTPSSSGLSSPERTKQYIPSKYQEPLTRQHSVRSKKPANCSSTVLRSWNLAKDVLVSCAICYRNVLQTFLQLLCNLCQRVSVRTVERLSFLDHSHSSLYIFCRSSQVTNSVTVTQHPVPRKIIFFLALNEDVSRQYATKCHTQIKFSDVNNCHHLWNNQFSWYQHFPTQSHQTQHLFTFVICF